MELTRKVFILVKNDKEWEIMGKVSGYEDFDELVNDVRRWDGWLEWKLVLFIESIDCGIIQTEVIKSLKK